MNKEIEQLEYFINGAETRRFHTWPVLREQTVGLHSFGVAWLCFWLQSGNVRPHLLLAALAHDLPEHKFGDMPAPTKRALAGELNHPSFRDAYDNMEARDARTVNLSFEEFLTDRERCILKLADAAEGALYCIRERRMGNQTIAVPFANFQKYMWKLYDNSDDRQTLLLSYINDMWEQADG